MRPARRLKAHRKRRPRGEGKGGSVATRKLGLGDDTVLPLVIGPPGVPPPAPGCELPLDHILASIERALIRFSLQRSASPGAAARRLGLSKDDLYTRMRRLGLSAPER